MPDTKTGDQIRLLRLTLFAAISLIAVLKILLATRLELYSDEIFYWQASTQPALGYSDLPFMAAFLAGLGTWLSGDSAVGVRTIFLVMGSSVPLLVLWLAKPLLGNRQALEAALLSLCLPLGAFLGLLAVPDVPLVFFGLLLIGLFERATRLDRPALWLATGLFTALGLSTHYRFVLYPAAMVLYLLVSRQHWYLWKTARLWIAGAIALSGFYPALSFNLSHELSGLDYHLVDRHPWKFQAEGLLHPFIQAGVVTPLLYALLLLTLILLLRQARQGDHRKGLFAAFALLHIAVFLLLAPWADSTRTTVHWPLSGYFPLIVYAPWTLRLIYQTLLQKYSVRTARALLLAVPLTGVLGSMLVFAGIGSQGFNEQLQRLIGPGVLSNKMAGWRPMNQHLQSLLLRHELPQDILIVTDNYYTAAQIEFHSGRTDRIYTIDNDKAVRDGRLTQYEIWQKNKVALLRQHPGAEILFITEDSTLNIDQKMDVISRACSSLGDLQFIEQLSLFQGDKAFSFYLGRDIGNSRKRHEQTEKTERQTAPCPYPSYLWVDHPQRGETLRELVNINGWAVNEGHGIEEITLLLNKQPYRTIERAVPRPDVVKAMAVHNDPEAPYLGFDYLLDTRQLPNGHMELSFEVRNRAGDTQLFGTRALRIDNP